jgi:hypothetical protein
LWLSYRCDAAPRDLRESAPGAIDHDTDTDTDTDNDNDNETLDSSASISRHQAI